MMLRFVADELEAGRYRRLPIPSTAEICELIPLSEGEDPEDSDNDALGFNYRNEDGVITLIVRVQQK